MYDVVLALDSGVSCGVASGVVSHHRRSRDGRKAFFYFLLVSSFFSGISLGTRKGKNEKITFFFNALLISSILGSPELLVPSLRRDRGLWSTSPVARCFFCVFLQEFERKNYKKACFPFSHVAIFSSHCDFWRLLATFGETTTLTW